MKFFFLKVFSIPCSYHLCWIREWGVWSLGHRIWSVSLSGVRERQMYVFFISRLVHNPTESYSCQGVVVEQLIAFVWCTCISWPFGVILQSNLITVPGEWNIRAFVCSQCLNGVCLGCEHWSSQDRSVIGLLQLLIDYPFFPKFSDMLNKTGCPI